MGENRVRCSIIISEKSTSDRGYTNTFLPGSPAYIIELEKALYRWKKITKVTPKPNFQL